MAYNVKSSKRKSLGSRKTTARKITSKPARSRRRRT